MKTFFFKWLAKLTGHNFSSTPATVIKDQMLEPRPLPMGRQEFEDWSDRIIGGALIPGDHVIQYNCSAEEEQKARAKNEIFVEGQKFALANMIMHIGPTESHKSDAHFIHTLRVAAIKQVAHSIASEIHQRGKDRLAAEAAAKKAAEEAEAESDAPIHLVTPEDCASPLN